MRFALVPAVLAVLLADVVAPPGSACGPKPAPYPPRQARWEYERPDWVKRGTGRENRVLPRFLGVGVATGVLKDQKDQWVVRESAESRAREELAADVEKLLAAANRQCCGGGTAVQTPEEQAQQDAEENRLPKVEGWVAAVVVLDTWKDFQTATYVLVGVPLERVLEAVDKCPEMPKRQKERIRGNALKVFEASTLD